MQALCLGSQQSSCKEERLRLAVIGIYYSPIAMEIAKQRSVEAAAGEHGLKGT